MRKTLRVSLLSLLLTAPAVAGEMPNPAPAPSPATANAVQEPTNDATPGDISTPGVSDIMTQIALDLLAVLL